MPAPLLFSFILDFVLWEIQIHACAFERLTIPFRISFVAGSMFSVSNNVETEAHGGPYTSPKLNVLCCK